MDRIKVSGTLGSGSIPDRATKKNRSNFILFKFLKKKPTK